MKMDKELSNSPLTAEVPSHGHRALESHASPTRRLSISPKSPIQSTTDQKPRLDPSDLCRDYVPSQGHGGLSVGSASFDKQLVGSPGGNSDRVFPIRSVVSVDPPQTPSVSLGRSSTEMHEGYFPPGSAGHDIAVGPQPRRQTTSISEIDGKASRQRNDTDSRTSRERSRAGRISSVSTTWSESGRYGGASRMQIFSDADSERSSNRADSFDAQITPQPATLDSHASADQEGIAGLVTARFKHIVTADGHAVITGRDGEILQRCEDEPIHIPGAVQSFGLLVAFQELEEGQLIARVVSENSNRIIGYTPEELFRLYSFTDILSDEQCDNLLDHIDFIRDDEPDPATNGPEVFTISVKPSPSRSSHRSQKLWCAMHINPANPDLVICEFELDDDPMYPLVPPNEETPGPPEDTLQSNPTQEELAESTHVTSKPLRVLRSARKRKGESAAMEVFNIMSQVQEQLAAAPNLESFLKILVGVVKELTGFHRVMIYQFDASFNGRVVTELVDPRATKDLYKGLNFPASDIPKQARDLYKVNKVRLLFDRDLETARLVCRSVEDLEKPLDLSFSYLRAMSPVHIKYLTNMAVRSSMSISINAFNELWGLIACHAYGSKGMRVSFPIRKMCRLVGDTASRNIERLSYASRLQARKLINTVSTQHNPSGYIIASSDDLLTLFDADFGLLSIKGETKILGKIDHSQEALAMLEYLRMRKLTSVITSQDIREDFPDLRYPPGFEVIAGLLLVPLSVGGRDFIVFFRKGQVKEVKWAGNPYEKFVKEGTEGYLEPRKSFKMWSETVVGKCREWTEDQVETAAVLCLVYGKFIEVWRQKEAAVQSSELTRLLLANSAHEVRTPLNAIINYLEIALEGSLDQETRDNLAKSHSASKSLIYVINDLLDLTKTEEGQDLIKDEIFDLPATIREATDSFKGDAKRKGLEYEIVQHPGVPKFVYGDQRRVRQAVSNITANAMQNTYSGWVRVEVWLQDLVDDRVLVEIVVQDTGTGMSNEKLDALFRDLEQVTTDGDFDDPEHANHALSRGEEGRTLGLGLAMVSRIVRNMEGQLRLKSEEGKGSRFVIQLPFTIPIEELSYSSTENPSSASTLSKINAMLPSAATPPPALEDGEVTLVDKPSSLRVDSISRKRSVEEITSTSLHSFKSGSSNKSNSSKKSDVDRLIDAISAPIAVGEPESEERTLQRSHSKESGYSRISANSLTAASRPSFSEERTGKLKRSMSYTAPEHLRQPVEGPAGTEFVKDNRTLLRAIKMPGECCESPQDAVPPHVASRVIFDVSDQRRSEHETIAPPPAPQKPDAEHLHVLVAEDDPVNSKIIQKRLAKVGHKVHHTVNGEDCASAYAEKPAVFDVVLMDIQMPIVDGLTSTKMIRSYEKTHARSQLSLRAAGNGRVPIFAVSASLVESRRQEYIEAGCDGWILKPINFQRLNTLLEGITNDKVRSSCLYRPGKWEKGGWFRRTQPSTSEATTTPSELSPIRFQPPLFETQPDKETLNGSEAGSITPTPKPEQRKQFIYDKRLDGVKKEENQSVSTIASKDRPVEDVTDDLEA